MNIMDISDEEFKRIIRRAKEIFPDPTISPLEFGNFVHSELELLICSKNAINITPINEEYVN